MLRLFRRFEDHAVSGGDCADQRHHRQLERIVPCGKDQHIAERFGADASFGGEVQHRGRDLSDRGVERKFPDHRGKLLQHDGGFRGDGFEFRLSEILFQRLADLRLAGLDFIEQRPEGVQTDVEIPSGKPSLRIQNLSDLVHDSASPLVNLIIDAGVSRPGSIPSCSRPERRSRAGGADSCRREFPRSVPHSRSA